ncbi:TVP38/TMEM64 family inner membrane protein YdjZ [Legionella massiliensis]|uniref:TVP38/TMEM64 family membrane protein n=1 Tax=Legionella massiliensis TaxID=1034943 RepID=A0A078KV84_9GAMM|nr:TVP38/TMEM64 family protein [Legionella massiliensis]CDZ76906.1 TVP38/TMEM64 family inner membrane protein YdjZ [Legionella massiliensis]CEE12644.1 TVP38/TMEM64 family inner membrane protein YdjZ [Legionella massiliensis]
MKTLWVALTIIAFIACAAVFQENAPLILNSIKGLGWLAPFLFLLLYSLATILLLPTMVLTFAGGALFGPLLGTLFNLTGATLGAVCAFAISRHLAIDWLTAQDKPKLNKLIAGVERGGWQFAALLRLIPIVPFNLVNYGLGMTRIKFSHYLFTTFVFLAPAEIIYTYCGYASMDVLTNPTPFYKNASLLILLCLIVLALILKLVKFYRAERKQDYS